MLEASYPLPCTLQKGTGSVYCT